MNHASAVVILALLLVGPLAVTAIEHNIELYCLALGVLATLSEVRFSARDARFVRTTNSAGDMMTLE